MKFVNGTLVQIYNHEHIWHGELAIVRDSNRSFCRVELLGGLTWVPEHWLLPVENNEQSNH